MQIVSTCSCGFASVKLAPEPQWFGASMATFDFDELEAGLAGEPFEVPMHGAEPGWVPMYGESFETPMVDGYADHPGAPAADPIQRPYEPNVEQAPLQTWRCLGCDSGDSRWSFHGWMCNSCGGKEFYRTSSPAKKSNEQGTWMFLPFGQTAGSMPRSSRRRRKRRPADPDGSDFGERAAESETPTVDPVVDPDLPHGPQERAGERVRPGPQARFGRDLQEPHGNQPRHLRDLRQSSATPSTDDQLLKALRSLVSKKEEDWSSQAGPSKGVRWRGGAAPQPPQWRYDRDDLRAYSKFVKKIEIWKLQVAPFMSKKEMALSLYNSLQGEAEQELEHTPIEEFYTEDGVDKIVEALRSPMEQKIVYQKRKYLAEFENVRRYSGETMRSYVNRFRRTQRCLRSVGVDVSLTYDAESMGARLLDRSGLSQEGQRLILVGTQQRLDFELVVESMMLQYPEFRGAPPVIGRDGHAITSSKGSSKGKASSSRSTSLTASTASSSSSSMGSSRGNFHRKVHLTEARESDAQGDGDEHLDPIDEEQPDQEGDDGELHDGDDDEELVEDDEEAPDIAGLAEVLTLTAKKLSSMTLGRKFTGRPNKTSKGSGKSSGSSSKSAADLKKVTHCSACGALGHWHEDPECL